MRRKIIPYNHKLKELARNLRKNSTLSEVILWGHLKGKQMLGYDFHRQRPVDRGRNRKPRLVGGVKGRTIIKLFLAGKPRPVGGELPNYIVDFYCSELLLAIEIDGESHDAKGEDDLKRQKRLESLGVRFLRFYDRDVKENVEGVVSAIEDWIKGHREVPS